MLITLAWLLATLLTGTRTARADAPLAVCATVPDLGSLVQTVGGDQVTVTVFTKPTEDPHFTPARPSAVKATSECQLLVLQGLDLEIGWLPVLLKGSRNGGIQPGQRGYLDASSAITPLEVPSGTVDRSMGDVHPFGNPHYLLDPMNGVRVARLIRDRLADLRPSARLQLEERYTAFERRLFEALVGPQLAGKYGVEVEKLARLHEGNRLAAFLESQGERDLLGGWLGDMAPHFGTAYVDDHRIWPYFARRFGLRHAGSLEPLSGIPPTTRHVQEIVAKMKAEHVRFVLASAYYDARHATFVAENSGATVLRMANLAGARPGTDDYLAMCAYNVGQVVAALIHAGGA
jgi:ABC-type Zn uptake system ZnuABC Zn-binding protein ZnuA